MLPSSVLAFVTTIHLGMASLRNHRRAQPAPISSLAAVSLLFAATPWLFSSIAGVVFGLAAHLAWFIACEVLAPPPPPIQKVSARAPSPTTPAVAPPGPTRPRGFLDVPILATFNETSDIKTIRLRRPEGFEFEAGQFITVRTRVDGKELSRCYSVSSAPDVRGYLEISVKRQGVVSNALHATARPGASLSIRSPNGAFKYPSADDRPLVLIAGGVGITPLISMLRHAVHTEPSRPVTLLYSARAEADFAFRDELGALSRRHPQIRVHLASSRASSPDVYPGRIDAELIHQMAPDAAHSVCFICGPASMIDHAKTALSGLGVPAAQIRHEVFEAAIAASAARVDSPPARVSGSAPHHMTCSQSGSTVPIAADQTLLEAAESAGVSIESLCRAGVCGTCRVRVTDGDVDCTSDALSAEEQAQGFVLACVATARSECTLDI
jgi:ferredoxin-NADP reductase